MRESLLLAALSALFIGTQAFAAGNTTDTAGIPDLIYDADTGNVTLDTDGGDNFNFFLLENAASSFTPGSYTGPTGDFNTIDSTTLSVTAFGGFGTSNLGAVLPTGFNLSGLEAYLTAAEYGTTAFGSGDFDLVVVPQPSALAILGLGLFLLARRRRHNA
ncbi:MAG: PEP-CTERM sorting domain-containing protein [Phycisphaeraceae bacterium]